jgi:hypothetical protein
LSFAITFVEHKDKNHRKRIIKYNHGYETGFEWMEVTFQATWRKCHPERAAAGFPSRAAPPELALTRLSATLP